MNLKKIALVAIAAILSVGFVGCKHKVGPVPYDTYPEGGVAGSSAGGIGGQVDNGFVIGCWLPDREHRVTNLPGKI